MPLTAKDILKDIEFEIMQGMISRDDLRKSVQEVQQFQNKMRGETFQALRPTDAYREIIARQYQINDMLITLLREMAVTMQTIESRQGRLPPSYMQLTTAAVPIQGLASHAMTARVPGFAPDEKMLTEIEGAMQPHALQVDFQPRSIGLPVVGWFITRARAYLHRLALFYVRQFANKQVPINRTFGDWILQMNQALQDQNEQIQALSAQLAALAARVTETTKPAGSGGESAMT